MRLVRLVRCMVLSFTTMVVAGASRYPRVVLSLLLLLWCVWCVAWCYLLPSELVRLVRRMVLSLTTVVLVVSIALSCLFLLFKAFDFRVNAFGAFGALHGGICYQRG